MMSERSVRRELLLAAAGWMLVMAVPAFGQEAAAGAKAPAFEVVSIKPNKSGPGMMRVMSGGDRYSTTNISLKGLIRNAYGIKMDDLISGLPGWADSVGFDIEAKIDGEIVAALKKMPNEQSAEQRRLMMQAMLAERFRLQIHHENKEIPMYALVIAKGGFKLKDADPNNTYPNGIKGPDGISHPGMMTMGNGKLTAQGIPISNLAANLSGQVHRFVVDKTGLTGKYDVTLQWSPDEIRSADTPETAGPSIFTAVEEQLGLKLEAVKGPADAIVVDHIEMPTEN